MFRKGEFSFSFFPNGIEREVNMTNREYLNTLSDEKLASLLSGSTQICNEMKDYCDEMKNLKTCCKECALRWIEMESTPRKGDVRKVKGGDFQDSYYMIVKVQKKDTKIMTSTGSFLLVSNAFIDTDEPADITAEEFLKMVVQNM